jgi:hypothetical protein
VGLSVFVWAMIGIAFWHFSVLVPDRFWGGIIGAFLAALAGALLSGFLLPQPGISAANPPRSGRGRLGDSGLGRRARGELPLRKAQGRGERNRPGLSEPPAQPARTDPRGRGATDAEMGPITHSRTALRRPPWAA